MSQLKSWNGGADSVRRQDTSPCLIRRAPPTGQRFRRLCITHTMASAIVYWIACACAELSGSDAVGSVAFHPLQSVLLSVSGSRHFAGEELDGSSSEEDADAPIRRPRTRLQPAVREATAKLWNFESSV